MIPSATVHFDVDSGAVQKSIIIPGTLLPDGRFRYITEWTDGAGMTVLVNYTLDAINNPTAVLSGQCKMTNATAASHAVSTIIELQLCPVIPGGTLFGGAVTLLLQTDASGGGVTCGPGAVSGWNAHISGSEYQGLFYCPFQMTKSGSGSIQASTTFGTPVPSKPGPNAASGLKLNHHFSITAGEVVTTTSTLVVKSLGSLSGCDADITNDGFIDSSDLGALLSQWGQTGWCLSSDINDDGLVDGQDLGGVLATWGACP